MVKLFDVQSGKKKKPFNVILFGVPGIGKSTWASEAPAPVFVGGEETGELDVARFPQSKTYQEFVDQVAHFSNSCGTLPYQTLVVDTLDSIEALLHQKILAEDPKQTGSMIAAHGGYGKAYEIAAGELVKLRVHFNAIREQGINLIFLAHSKKAQAVDAILGMQYDTYELSLHQKAQSVFVEWVSAVFFANYIVHAQSGTNTEKIFATGDGARVLLTEKRPGHLGKNRFSLPYEMPLEFRAFFTAFNEFFDSGPKLGTLLDSVMAMAEMVADQGVKQKVFEQIAVSKTDMAKLLKIKGRLEEIIK